MNAEWGSLLCETAIVRPRATVLTLKRARMEVPALDPNGGYFGTVTLSPHKLLVTTPVSCDSDVSMLQSTAIKQIAWQEDRAFLRGSGCGEPLGILDAPGTLTVSRAQGNAITRDDLVRMMEAFIPVSSGGVWTLSRPALRSVIESFNDYSMRPPMEGVHSLYGFPVITTEHLPKTGQRGDVVLADWKHYLIGHRSTTVAEARDVSSWQKEWQIVHRVDGCPWGNAPIELNGKQVSPFVILGGVAEAVDHCTCIVICIYCGRAWEKGTEICWNGQGCGASLLDPGAGVNVVCSYCGRIWPESRLHCWDGADGCGAALGGYLQ